MNFLYVPKPKIAFLGPKITVLCPTSQIQEKIRDTLPSNNVFLLLLKLCNLFPKNKILVPLSSSLLTWYIFVWLSHKFPLEPNPTSDTKLKTSHHPQASSNHNNLFVINKPSPSFLKPTINWEQKIPIGVI